MEGELIGGTEVVSVPLATDPKTGRVVVQGSLGIERRRVQMMLRRAWSELRAAARQPPEVELSASPLQFAQGISLLREGNGVYSTLADGSVLLIEREGSD